MFNRVIKCLISVKKPLSLKPKRQTITLINSQYSNSNLLLKRCFCSEPLNPRKVDTREDEMKIKEEVKEEKEKEEEEKKIEENETKNSENDNELQALIKSDPTMEKRYKILQLELEVMRGAGKLVPDVLKPLQWVQLLREQTRSARTKYLTYLFKTERTKENLKQRKLEARAERELRSKTMVLDKTGYGLHKTTMFLRIYDTAIHRFYNSRLFQSMMFGQKLIIDCGHYPKMTTRETTECSKQLGFLFAENRVHRDPFDLHFCNAHKNSLLMQKFKNIIPPIYDNDFPLNISEASYLETFDKEKLVYLTPDCNNELHEYDPDSIYIIGAIVDKTNNDPLSLAKAKKEGLRMAKLPLDKYLLWGSGAGKRLPLNQMVSILNDLKNTGDWQKALQHVPRRKLERDVGDYQPNYVQQKRPLVDIPFQRKETKYRRQYFSFEERQNRKRFSDK